MVLYKDKCTHSRYQTLEHKKAFKHIYYDTWQKIHSEIKFVYTLYQQSSDFNHPEKEKDLLQENELELCAYKI